jgi:aryl-alcohol dehydrogenase-like predicted oxidoreductase
MERRRFGRTDLDMSLLTFGCGAVGGLMTKGDAGDQDRAVAWARDNGINHFDTAPLYGNGASEENLGRALGGNRDGIIVSTKVRLQPDDRGRLDAAIRASIEASLRRLQQDSVDLFQLHNTLGAEAQSDIYSADEILNDVVPAFERLRDEGKTRYLGFTANGDTDAIHTLLDSGRFDGAQIFYNILNPTAGERMPPGYPAQDYRQALTTASRNGVGTIGVRVLAGGAMSGRMDRHPLGMQTVDPIGSGEDYARDVDRALRFTPLIDAGHSATLPELAIRYVIANPSLTTTEIGIATLDELQQAASAINKGALPPAATGAIDRIREGFVGEAR